MTISEDQASAIINFMQAVRRLRDVAVIRSDRYLGDLGEFLAAAEYGLVLAGSSRQEGHDTAGGNDRVQIKFHNSPTRTNINLGSPDKYERVVVVLGPDSYLCPQEADANQYRFYEFTSDHVKRHFNAGKAYSCGKEGLGVPQRMLTIQSTGAAAAD